MTDPGLNAVEQKIREAQARGEFDDLPGAGKPLQLRGVGDPDWWVKGLIERENLDMSGALPPTAQLRKEAETYPESLVEVTQESSVREILEDFNRRVKQDRLRPTISGMSQIVAPTVDVEEMVQRWAELRRERAQRSIASDDTPPKKRRWWRR